MSPFDHNAWTERLDITICRLSDVRLDNRVFRIDSTFFSKAALEAERTIKKCDWSQLSDLSDRIESFGAYALTNLFTYVEEGIPFLRCLNIRDGFTEFTNVLHITPKAHKLLSKSEVCPEMVLLTMSGSVGNLPSRFPPGSTRSTPTKTSQRSKRKLT
jgi:hypothetical protein